MAPRSASLSAPTTAWAVGNSRTKMRASSSVYGSGTSVQRGISGSWHAAVIAGTSSSLKRLSAITPSSSLTARAYRARCRLRARERAAQEVGLVLLAEDEVLQQVLERLPPALGPRGRDDLAQCLDRLFLRADQALDHLLRVAL